jgi:hypothetical protein
VFSEYFCVLCVCLSKGENNKICAQESARKYLLCCVYVGVFVIDKKVKVCILIYYRQS